MSENDFGLPPDVEEAPILESGTAASAAEEPLAPAGAGRPTPPAAQRPTVLLMYSPCPLCGSNLRDTGRHRAPVNAIALDAALVECNVAIEGVAGLHDNLLGALAALKFLLDDAGAVLVGEELQGTK